MVWYGLVGIGRVCYGLVWFSMTDDDYFYILFTDRQTDRQTDRRTLVLVKLLSQLKTHSTKIS